MAGITGQIRDSGDQWLTYIEQFEHYILANEIRDEKKVLVLLSVMGPKTYRLLHSLIAPTKPGDVDYTRMNCRHISPPNPL